MDRLEALIKANADLKGEVDELKRLRMASNVVKSVTVERHQESIRKGEYSISDTSFFKSNPELQRMSDELYLASVLLKKSPNQLNYYGEYKNQFEKFMKTNQTMDSADAGYGADWIPTQLSNELIQRVLIELRVAGLHMRFNMPTPVYKYPTLGGRPTAYVQTETKDDAFTNAVTPSNTGTGAVTFTAKKLAVRIITSLELEEDSIIPVLPQIRNDIALALAEAQETAVINGDTTGTHMDYDTTAAADVRKAWKGYRKLAIAAAKSDLSTFNTTNLRKIRAGMGKYGIDPTKLAWVVGVVGYTKMLGLTECLTMEKFGDKATIATGTLAKLDGIDVIPSGYIREDVDSTGVNSVTTGNNTKSVLHLVFKPGFGFGDRRLVTVKLWEDIQRDQQVMVATQRMDFEPFFDCTAEPIVGEGYNFS